MYYPVSQDTHHILRGYLQQCTIWTQQSAQSANNLQQARQPAIYIVVSTNVTRDRHTRPMVTSAENNMQRWEQIDFQSG